MKKLPLITPEPLPIELEESYQRNPNCVMCPLHKFAKNPCIEPSYDGQGDRSVLLVGEAPGAREDLAAQAFVGPSGLYLKDLVRKHWGERAVYDNALLCYPGTGEMSKANLGKAVDSCRSYLADSFRRDTFDRVVLLGSTAMLSFLGRGHSPDSVRRGWTWVRQDPKGPLIPVFLLMHPARAMRNKFHSAWFESDLKWALTTPAPFFKPAFEGIAQVVSNQEDAEIAYQDIIKAKSLSFDCEWFGAQYDNSFVLLSVAICREGSPDAWVWDRRGVTHPGAVSVLRRLMEDPSISKSGHYIKADKHAMWCGLKIEVSNVRADTQIFIKLQETESRADLNTAGERVGMGGHKAALKNAMVYGKAKTREEALRVLYDRIGAEAVEQITGAPKTKKAKKAKNQTLIKMDEVDSFMENVGTDLVKAVVEKRQEPEMFAFAYVNKDVRDAYNGADAVVTQRLVELLERRLKRDGNLYDVWEHLVGPATEAIYRVERAGFPINRDAIYDAVSYFNAELGPVRARLEAYGDFNPDSAKDLRRFLYEQLKLPILKMTHGKKPLPSTDDDALDLLAPHHPNLMHDLQEYRKLSKYLSTYSEGYLRFVRDDGRVHCNIKPDGARSGRLSADEPALQTIPASDEDPLSIRIRNFFQAKNGYIFLKMDYSQLEYRVAAWLAQDPVMRDIFINGYDFHSGTAAVVFNVPINQVKKDQRRAAKTINFGTMYGMGAWELSRQLTAGEAKAGSSKVWDEQEAADLQNSIMGRFARFSQFVQTCLREGRTTGFTWTWWRINGIMQKFRRRMLPSIGDHDEKKRKKGERGTWNSPIQGTASDVCLASMIKLWKFIDDNLLDAEIVMTIHDALIFHVKKEYVEEFLAGAVPIMEDWDCWGVPIKVDIEIGEEWGSMIHWEDWMGAQLPAVDWTQIVQQYEAAKKKP